MRNLDRDKHHSLKETVVHLDVIHSRTKGFKTYSLSYYDLRLNSMVVLCTMDCISECKEMCTIFLEKRNEMLRKQASDNGESTEDVELRPFHLNDDEHEGNKIGMANVFGKYNTLREGLYAQKN